MEAPANRSPSSSANKATVPKESDNAPSDPADDSQESLLEETHSNSVKQFLRLLGTAENEEKSSNSKALLKLLSPYLEEQNVVLSLPSLDMQLTEGDQGNDNSMMVPAIGQHGLGFVPLPPKSDSSNVATDASTDSSILRPTMIASIILATNESTTDLEVKASQSVGKVSCWTKSSVAYAAAAIKTNVSSSFESLILSLVKSWTLLLLRHSLAEKDGESRSRLMNMLSASVEVENSDIKFETVPMPKTSPGQPKEADVILPLLFEVVHHVKIQGRGEKVTMRAPGTVVANFISESDKGGIKDVKINLDTGSFVKSMVYQARMVVLKAVASSKKGQAPQGVETGISQRPGTIGAQPSSGSDGRVVPSHQSIIPSTTLAGFKSALNLSHADTQQSQMLEKAKSSALRLNDTLHGKSVESKFTQLGLRKVRSVRWDATAAAPKLPAALAPAPKRHRLAENAAKLKSFKSFGRPHAGDFGSGPRNATFGEYGGRQQMWGRDGRLVHHPMPLQKSTAFDQFEVVDKNATFDLDRQRRPDSTSPGPATSIPRSATILEKLLMKK